MKLSQQDLDAIKSWLEYGNGSLGKSHKGYFSEGGWAYEQLKNLSERISSEIIPELPPEFAKVCAVCHWTFGSHYGDICPDDTGTFVERIYY